ncbi:MAG: hypothetical protein JXA14_15835, partial [Anaerolineae bacterium]|nr:hypothetical protein [Anaerolineae bacterium]
ASIARFFVAPAAPPPPLLRMTILSDRLLVYTIERTDCSEWLWPLPPCLAQFAPLDYNVHSALIVGAFFDLSVKLHYTDYGSGVEQDHMREL